MRGSSKPYKKLSATGVAIWGVFIFSVVSLLATLEMSKPELWMGLFASVQLLMLSVYAFFYRDRRRLAELGRKESKTALKSRYYQLLHEASLGLLNRTERHELMQSILQLLARASEVNHSFLFLYDPATDRMVRRFGAGIHETLPVDVQSYGRGEAVVGTVWETGKMLQVEDYRAWGKRDMDPWFLRFTTILAVPVRSGKDEIVGVMGLTFLDQVGTFEPELAEFLESAAQLAAVALDNLNLVETLQGQEANARSLFEQSVDALAIFDDETKECVKANRRFCEMTGYSPEQLLNLTAYEIIIDTSEGIDQRFSLKHLSGGENFASEIRRLRCNGGRIVEVERTLSRIVQDNRVMILGSWRDVSAENRLREQTKRELRSAGMLQRSLLPPEGRHGDLEIRTVYQPRHEVSGDFFWYRWTQSGNLLKGFLLDVMGHGIGTALQTAAINVLFHQALEEGLAPRATLQRVNRQCQGYFGEDVFAAALCFEIDMSRMTLCYAAGGITSFLASTGRVRGVVKAPGSLIGIDPDPEFDECQIPLQTGDSFYFVTDGLMDLLTTKLPQSLHDFGRTMEELQTVASYETRRDDASALCIHISGGKAWPVYFEISRSDDLVSMRQRLRETLDRTAGTKARLIEVILNEAINNSLRNQGALVDKGIRVKLNKIGSRLVIRVRDYGKGFDATGALQRLKDVWADETADDGHAEGGRGIQIMWKLSDRLFYNSSGTEILFIKQIMP